MKDYLVEFTDNGARIIKDPDSIEKKKNNENVLLNPVIPNKVSPSKWVKNGDKIGFKMNDGEIRSPFDATRHENKSVRDALEKLEKDIKEIKSDAFNTEMLAKGSMALVYQMSKTIKRLKIVGSAYVILQAALIVYYLTMGV
jgi:hypothetical protein